MLGGAMVRPFWRLSRMASPTYLNALAVFCAASQRMNAARVAFRSAPLTAESDTAFLAARAEFDAAQRVMDAAELEELETNPEY
jgi:hypothetical protein